MKTSVKIVLAMACFSLLSACSKSNDDPATSTSLQTLKKVNATGTGTIVYHFDPGQWMPLPIFCNGELVDQVMSSSDFLFLSNDHYRNNEQQWWINRLRNIVFTSMVSGEVFRMEGWEKTVVSDGFDQVHFTLIGDKGSHYSCQMTADIDNSQVFEVRSVCSKKFVTSLQ